MKGKKAGKGCVVYGEPASEPGDQVRSNVGESGEEVRDNSGTPKPHLPPGQDVAKESRSHNKDQKQYTSGPGFDIYVPPVVKPSPYMAI